ncbi:MAG: hypothetical protein ACOY4K_00585 [Pseudomonadota bacterium]
MAAFSTMAMIGSAVLGAGASIYGANKQADAAKDAARASKKATDASLALQREMWQQTRADQEPWRLAGQGALGRLQDPNAFMASPDYQFRLSEGLKSVAQNRAVAGLLNSGSTLRGFNDYAQDTAAGEYGAWWNRQAGLAGIGQAANSINANAGSAYANASQNALMANAQQQGQSAYYGANAMAQGVGNAAGMLGWGLSNLPWGGSGGGSAGAHLGGMSPTRGGVPWSIWRN